MEPARIFLFALLTLVAGAFAVVWAQQLSRRRQWAWPTWYENLVGFVTEFFDALGIGSFATTTALYRVARAVPDEKIPGTLNIGHCLPTAAQAIVFAGIIAVEPKTLVLLIAAAVLGSWLGAGFVTRWSRRRIQLGMGSALLVAAGLFLAKIYNVFPEGGDAVGLEGAWLAGAAAGSFVCGALMTIGIGAYAPIMIMVSLLGMNPKAAFPIMMGACAFLMPVCGTRFLRADAYAPRAAIGLTLAGVPAVLIAAYIVQELPLETVRWLVVVVVIYTAITLLLAARKEGEGTDAEPL